MDGLCLKSGIYGVAPVIPVGGGVDVRSSATHVSTVGRSGAETPTAGPQSQKASPFRFSFRHPLKSLWPGGKGGGVTDRRHNGLALDDAVVLENGDVRRPVAEVANIKGGLLENGDVRTPEAAEDDNSERRSMEEQSGNWVFKILQVRSIWKDEDQRKCSEDESDPEEEKGMNGAAEADDCGGEEECDVCRIDTDDNDDETETTFDRDSFSKLLRKASLAEAKLYAQMSYLGNLAYSIPRIKPENLWKYHGLRFVTSSIETREAARKTEKDQVSAKSPEVEASQNEKRDAEEQNKSSSYRISASSAYQIAASAASYLHSHTKSILPFRSSKGKEVPEGGYHANAKANDDAGTMDAEVASLVATTDSVTAVVAAKEEVKQAVADDLKSTMSSPCEWFICDDDQSSTRFFVIQGSETLSSWQANLLFEPIQFEGLDVLVHRGIYEAGKGIYEQMLPEVRKHLKSNKNRAKLRFTGHSLGGSLSLLINLMLLIRGEAPVSALLPVITFGAPCILCGGDRLLQKLGLPKSHVQAITMHRDIVPRAFSCNYPNHVAKLLKAVNGNFRNHPCLNNQKMLYAPMGELLILQPDENFSPQHDLLPSGSGLYFLTCPLSDIEDVEKRLRAAKMVFLNSPHPLEILSDRSAYGSEGTIQRDHDMNSYLKSVRSVIRQELNRIRKSKREHRRKLWWPLLVPRGVDAGIILGAPVDSVSARQERVNFSGIVQTGRESLRRFSRLVASQHMHLLVVLLFPAKLLVLGAFGAIGFR